MTKSKELRKKALLNLSKKKKKLSILDIAYARIKFLSFDKIIGLRHLFLIDHFDTLKGVSIRNMHFLFDRKAMKRSEVVS